MAPQVATVETWREKDTHVEISQAKGTFASLCHPGHSLQALSPRACTGAADFFCTLTLKAMVPLSPDEIFDILVDPNNQRIFRGIKVGCRGAREAYLR